MILLGIALISGFFKLENLVCVHWVSSRLLRNGLFAGCVLCVLIVMLLTKLIMVNRRPATAGSDFEHLKLLVVTTLLDYNMV